MRSRLVFAISMVSFLTGCTHSYLIGTSTKKADIPYEKVEAELESYKVKIIFLDRRVYSGINVKVSTDSTYWLDPITNKSKVAANIDLTKLTIVSYIRGFTDGLLIGIPLGLITGFVSFVGLGSGHILERIQNAEIYSLSVMAGLPILFTIGGSTNEYIFNPQNIK